MTRQNRSYIWITLLLLSLSMDRAVAQNAPPFVIQGPVVTADIGCDNDLDSNCVSIDYDQSDPTSATIVQKRLLQVPRGNLLFKFPVSSFVPGTSRIHTTVGITVSVTVAGANGEVASGVGSKTFHTFGSAMVQIPINIDWAVSTVTFHMQVSELQTGVCGGGCANGFGEFNGPDLSNVSLGLSLPAGFPSHAFVLVETPAAA